MTALLEKIPATSDPNLLVGFDTSDDAGVYRLDGEQALVVTADFITPPVDDPYIFGQIAAANSLSDVYAMGGKPLVCLNLVCFPSDKLGADVLQGIIEGANERIQQAGAILIGGHSVEDAEPKFGLAVTGMVHPEKYWSNAGAQVGDSVILTKPLGSGVILNANVKKKVSEGALQSCLDKLIELNATTSGVLADFDVHAVTDVTGFGLCGHALEIAKASNLLIEIDSKALPLFDEAILMYDKGFTTGANEVNRAQVEAESRFGSTIPKSLVEVLMDPQTSGGLLVTVPESEAGSVVHALHSAGVEDAVVIGQTKQRVDSGCLAIL
ncbi:MAG TPA: selenide, water dikinase SelD [Gammaproteobacteria bacterium]|nr:selenide, water dikinase SelD [Gammaproteobacteria bacterium]